MYYIARSFIIIIIIYVRMTGDLGRACDDPAISVGQELAPDQRPARPHRAGVPGGGIRLRARGGGHACVAGEGARERRPQARLRGAGSISLYE